MPSLSGDHGRLHQRWRLDGLPCVPHVHWHRIDAPGEAPLMPPINEVEDN